MSKIKKITVKTRYCIGDDNFEEDYCEIQLINEDGEIFKTFEDHYHEQGSWESFVDGIEHAQGSEVLVDKVQIADYEY